MATYGLACSSRTPPPSRLHGPPQGMGNACNQSGSRAPELLDLSSHCPNSERKSRIKSSCPGFREITFLQCEASVFEQDFIEGLGIKKAQPFREQHESPQLLRYNPPHPHGLKGGNRKPLHPPSLASNSSPLVDAISNSWPARSQHS